MYSDIYKLICEFDKIILARHVGVDPDAMASVMALKDSILLTFPEKKSMLLEVEVIVFRILEN